MMLPNFLVVGAAKSGTTSLWYYLDKHPQIFMSSIKETNFFSHDLMSIKTPITNIEEYQKLFQGAESSIARGEISNAYLNWAPDVAPRIHETIPECRIIVILRNPVERLYSRYWHAVRDQYYAESFANFSSLNWQVELLGEKIEVFKKLFGKDKLLVVFLEDMEESWDIFSASLFPFLGVDVPKQIHIKLNQSGKTRSKFVNDYIVRGPTWVRAPAKLLKPNWRARLRTAIQKFNTLDKPPMDMSLRKSLQTCYEKEILYIENLAGRIPISWMNTKM